MKWLSCVCSFRFFFFFLLYTVFESLLLFSSDKSIKSIPSSFEFFSIHWNIFQLCFKIWHPIYEGVEIISSGNSKIRRTRVATINSHVAFNSCITRAQYVKNDLSRFRGRSSFMPNANKRGATFVSKSKISTADRLIELLKAVQNRD